MKELRLSKLGIYDTGGNLINNVQTKVQILYSKLTPARPISLDGAMSIVPAIVSSGCYNKRPQTR